MEIREPVCVCSTEALQELLKEWKTRLFLDDWIIKAMFAEPDDPDLSGLCGINKFQVDNKCSIIKLCTESMYGEGRIIKYCVELTLVHELLHCKYNWLKPPETMEGSYFDVMEHALMEQMAKSLLMAKYNIPFSWFMNLEA